MIGCGERKKNKDQENSAPAFKFPNFCEAIDERLGIRSNHFQNIPLLIQTTQK